MGKNTPIDRVLRIAIRKEEEARAFYIDLTRRVSDASTKDTLEFLAGEEAKHKAFLQDYLEGKIPEGTLQLHEVVDYRIVEHLEEEETGESETLTPEKAFTVAAKREKSAYEFYAGLSRIHPSGQVKDLLLKMANEELRHKEKMEYLYANTAFPQTAGG